MFEFSRNLRNYRSLAAAVIVICSAYTPENSNNQDTETPSELFWEHKGVPYMHLPYAEPKTDLLDA